MPETVLVGMLGRASGRQLHALAHNRDPRRVTVGVRRRSIGGQRAIGRRGQPKAPEYLDEVLVGLIDRITRRLRAARRVARTVILRLRFDDFSRATRSLTIAEATAESRVLLGAARELMEAALPTLRVRGCTLVGLSLTNLEDIDAVQLALPGRPRADARAGRGRRRGARPVRVQAADAWRAARARHRDRDADAAERLRTDPDRNTSVGCPHDPA